GRLEPRRRARPPRAADEGVPAPPPARRRRHLGGGVRLRHASAAHPQRGRDRRGRPRPVPRRPARQPVGRPSDGRRQGRLVRTAAGALTVMRAWEVRTPAPISSGPLVRAERDVPEPGRGELLVRVLACGVCRTDLHVAEGDLPVHLPGVTPGHEIVGEVVAAGEGTLRGVGDRVGVAWLRGTCGACRFCRRGAENLCPASVYTGWDAHGGYAEYALPVDANSDPLPPELDGVRAAPLLCAGIIGYRARRRAEVPPGGRLGIWGFGGSAHLAAQIAIAEG